MLSILTSKLVAEILMLHRSDRHELWKHVISTIESYSDRLGTLPIRAELDPTEVRRALALIDFKSPLNPVDAVDLVGTVLGKYQTHTGSPRYFGLFDPAPTTMGIAAAALVAAFNPQLASWSQCPAAIEMEQLLVRAFGEKFGYESDCIDGTFASGGAEANHTALLTALIHSFPDFRLKGVRALSSKPVLYISSEGHHSVLKAARLCGLGDEAVRVIPVDSKLRMDVDALSAQITEERSAGLIPFLVVATAGTTNAGAVDPLVPIGQVAARERQHGSASPRRICMQLCRSGNEERYMRKLVGTFNPATVDGLMCRNLVSVDWTGRLYDCDFNQMLELGVASELPQTISDFIPEKFARRSIMTGSHCFGCTAGSGSSCGGAVTVS
ncbi:MAG TPA: DUF3641 domain-containing protein [Pyrinomonadaceae bacterium]|jgi:hypothetical protein|nr:DUF3641 domain-containing protein [Pyrinomonadaceae bacterium]